MIIYPIALGTFFKLAFGNIYDNDIKFSQIKVAVVENAGEDTTLRNVLKEISEGEDALLDVSYMTEDEAVKALKDEEVKGIITDNGTLSLTVSSNGIRSTILEKFVERYNLNVKIIGEAAGDPEKLKKVAAALSKDYETITAKALSKGNTNIYDQYFYNLIAMVALFGSMTGLHISIENQGNLSALGARKCVSPTPKSLTILSALAATFVMQTICMVISVTYIHFGLGVDMGNRLGFFYLTAIIAGMVGSSLGFFVGSINKASLSTKNSICTAVSLMLCFLSGLMDGGMKQKVAESAPWFNKINPAAVICDSLFSLNIYEDFERYNRCVLTMLITTALFIFLGFMFTRRRKYASL
ncbi:MAG: ABC transporter permease [Lachnospiraceae bacterium]|nr:ABC transporter permease [Lachnospiraceae bacterium]